MEEPDGLLVQGEELDRTSLSLTFMYGHLLAIFQIQSLLITTVSCKRVSF